MTASYRYLFCDLLTDTPITTLELTGVTFERRIVQAGTFTATIPIPNRQVAGRVRKVFPAEDTYPPPAGPGRVICHVLRDGEVWGSYIIWQTTATGDERGKVALQLQGASLESYLHRREIWADLTFTAVDQITIAHGLVGAMQAEAGGDLGIGVTGAPSGTVRDRSYKASETATFGDRLVELANTADGFEYFIRTYTVGGNRVREFVTGYPRLGNPGAVADMVFTRPGTVLNWSYGNDASGAATRWRAKGDGTGDEADGGSEPSLSSPVTTEPLLAAGWPCLDQTVNHQGTGDVATLTGYAAHQAAMRAGTVRIPQITVRLDQNTPVHPGRLGDHARVTIVDDWWPLGGDGRPTFAHTWRIVGISVTPAHRGAEERATLIFEEDRDGDA